MSVLVVTAHPDRRSLTHALGARFAEGLEEAGIAVDRLDLYELGFQPVLSASEIARWASGERPPEVLEQQRRVGVAQGLALVYPVWWAAPPAILQGWLQRVFTEGFAYHYQDKAVGLMPHPVQLIVNAGTRDETLRAAYVEPILGVLRYCGFGPTDALMNWGIHPQAPSERIAGALKGAHEAAGTFAAQYRLSKDRRF